jgi:hypothetical protein
MAKFENKDLTGAMFKNEYKQRDNQPDVTGTARINGVDFKVSGWNKTTSSGKRMVSLAFTEIVEDAIPSGNGKTLTDDELLF